MAQKRKDFGLSYSSKKNIKSFIKEDGTSNVIHINRSKTIDDLYTYLISISWPLFFVFITLGYLAINILFALLYLIIGIDQLTIASDSLLNNFLNAFFFSAQTVTTVGYGTVSPQGVGTGILSSFEAFIGLLSFSFITGLLYGRFSKPKASVRFSKPIALRKFEEERALMFRLANKRKSIMIEPKITVTLSISNKNENGTYKRNFYPLNLQYDKITYLPTIWTVVHKIDNESPLYNYSNEEISKLNARIYILFEYHEDSFSQRVYQMHSYDFKEIVPNVKFKSSIAYSEDGYTILDHDVLNQLEPED